MTAAPQMDLVRFGDLLAGKYRVERVLGRGAMGMVVAAMHVDLQERRAIKFMLPEVLDNAEGVERFMREARACARLKSKHVAAVYDVGRLENGAPYIVMEYLEGRDLKDVLRHAKVLPVQQAADYLLQALEAIGEAHQAGIVHRDLKPANIFLAAGVGGVPCIKLLDFGIAKLNPAPGADADVQEMTATAVMMGTPLYMSPEQMRSSRLVDGRCDIWALGVILFRMLTGTTPFQGSTGPELYAAVLKDPAPLPSALNPTLPPQMDAIILRCLEKDPDRRWQSAAELAEALRQFVFRGAPSPNEDDRTTPYWRPPQASLPDGWFGDSVGSDVQPTRRAPESGGSAPAISHRSTPTQLRREDDHSAALQSSFGVGPVIPPAPPSAGGNDMLASVGGVGASQTGGSWSQTGRRLGSRGHGSQGMLLAAALGGGLAVVVGAALFLVFRGGDGGEPAAPSPAPPASLSVQVRPDVLPSSSTPVEPSPSTEVAPTVTATSTGAPSPSQVPKAKAAKKSAPPGKTVKPTVPGPNPFD